LKVTFLGTGTSQGIPVIACQCPVCFSTSTLDKRLRTSALIEIKGVNILIDAGPDFRQQMLKANVQNLDAILLTHEHRDHIAGLDDVRAFNYVQQKPMDVYAEDNVQTALQQEFPYIFAKDKYPGVPEINLHTIGNKAFDVSGISVLPIRVMHRSLPILGFRIESFTYITDANFITDEEKQKIAGSEFLVLNGLRKEKHISHYALEEVLQLIEEISPKHAYITHISHQMGFHNEVQTTLPSNVILAYDGLTLEFD
jgi:phosphoribosyl 1,2-cyclic phosphate phosphodiesterase